MLKRSRVLTRLAKRSFWQVDLKPIRARNAVTVTQASLTCVKLRSYRLLHIFRRLDFGAAGTSLRTGARKNPSRWFGKTRNWQHKPEVHLNPHRVEQVRDKSIKIEAPRTRHAVNYPAVDAVPVDGLSIRAL